MCEDLRACPSSYPADLSIDGLLGPDTQFQYNVSYALDSKPPTGTGYTESWATMVECSHRVLLPLFTHIETLILVLCPIDHTITHAWPTILLHSNHVKTLRFILDHKTKHFPSIENKCCTESLALSDILPTLATYKTQGDEAKKSINFPLLEHVDLWSGAEVLYKDTKVFFESLCEALKDRKRIGMGIKKLTWTVPLAAVEDHESFDDLVLYCPSERKLSRKTETTHTLSLG